MNVELTCVSSTASENGGFVLKLQNKADKTNTNAFGTIIQKSQQTYYMKVAQPVAPGFKAELNLDMFKVTEMPYVLPEGAENAGDTVQLKWLFL